MPESRIVLFDINASLPVHVNLSFWFLDFFLTVLSIKSIELFIAKDGIVNLFIGIVRDSFFYLGVCYFFLDQVGEFLPVNINDLFISAIFVLVNSLLPPALH